MSEVHVPFEKLSDLFDDEVTRDEKEQILRHLDSCPECFREFQRLKTMLDLCGQMRRIEISFDRLAGDIMRKHRSRRTRRILVKVAPALAASVVLVFGFALSQAGFFRGKDEIPLAHTEEAKVQPTEAGDVDEIVSIMRNNRATILNVSDLYVEGQTTLAEFNRLRRDLGFRSVTFSVVDALPQQQRIMKSGIAEVGTGNDQISPYAEQNSGEKRVIFRVFR